MINQGLDFAWGTLNIGAAQASKGWCARYLCPLSEGKQITIGEADRYAAAKFPFIVVWEDELQNPLRGANQGRTDGAQAGAQARALGQPTTRPIYVAVDFNASSAELPIIEAYFTAFKAACGGYELGCYGSTFVIAAMQAAGLAKYGWQCESTGYAHNPAAFVHVLQSPGGSAWGVSYDSDVALQADFGQWYPGWTPGPAPSGPHANAPCVGICTTPTDGGYWQVGADGGVFTFGDAGFYGGEGGQHLNAPIVGMDCTNSGRGYWLAAADGGVFSFGDAPFHGGMAGKPLNAPIIDIRKTVDGAGYYLVAADYGLFAFNSPFLGNVH